MKMQWRIAGLTILSGAFLAAPLSIVACANSNAQDFKSVQAIVQKLNQNQQNLQMLKDRYSYDEIQSLVQQDNGKPFISELKEVRQLNENDYVQAQIEQQEIHQGWINFKLHVKSLSNTQDQATTKWLQVQYDKTSAGSQPPLPSEPVSPAPDLPSQPGPEQPPLPPTSPPVEIPPVNPDVDQTLLKEVKSEVARINQANLSFKNPTGQSTISYADVNKINADNLLNNYINGLSVNSGFQARVVHLSVDPYNLQNLAFNLQVNKSNAIVMSERFVVALPLENLSPQAMVNQESQRFNQLSLKPLYFENAQQLDNGLNIIHEKNVLKKIMPQVDFNRAGFVYESQDFQRDYNKKEIRFKIVTKYKGASSISQVITWKMINANTKFKTPAFEAEMRRLASLPLKLKNPNLTIEQVRQLNVNNFLSQLSGFTNNSQFVYKVDNILKSPNQGEISFQIWLNHAGLAHHGFPLEDMNYVNFKVKINLVASTSADAWDLNDDTYIKEQATPITTGDNYLATPGTNGESIKPSSQQGTHPSTGIEPNASLMKGKIFSELEKNQLKNTFSLGFESEGMAYAFGTGWILDYQIPDNGDYPTTWYFATNSHVIQNLKVANDLMSPERYEPETEPFQNTKYLDLRTPKNPQIGQSIDHTGNRDQWLQALIPATNLRTIFIGNDYLKTSPSDFSHQGNWASSEEYIDFAVLEVKFESPEQAKMITQDYVTETQRHFKYKQESLLKQGVNPLNQGYSVIGFPATRQDAWWRPVELTSSRSRSNEAPSAFTNLGSAPYYNSFVGKTGMFDAALGLSFFGYNYREAYQLNTFYTSSGLIYPVDYGNLGEGSSGSMLMDQNGFTTGIHFAADNSASMGFATALYSEGFNYGGRFNRYNLQGYDLIDGNRNNQFPNQKISYRTNMLKLYGNNVKTNLYPQGLTNNLRPMN